MSIMPLLPKGKIWTVQLSNTKSIPYYYNVQTNKSVWNRPNVPDSVIHDPGGLLKKYTGERIKSTSAILVSEPSSIIFIGQPQAVQRRQLPSNVQGSKITTFAASLEEKMTDFLRMKPQDITTGTMTEIDYKAERKKMKLRHYKETRRLKKHALKNIGQQPGSFVEKTESQPQTNTNICKSFSVNHSLNGQMPGDASSLTSYSGTDDDFPNPQSGKKMRINSVETLQSFSFTLPTNKEAMEDDSMEWETSDQPINLMETIQHVRQQGCKQHCTDNDWAIPQSSNVINSDSEALYVVVDTNVFIGALNFAKHLSKIFLPDGRPIVVVAPWQVLQELDHMKKKKKGQHLNMSSLKVQKYLYTCFSEANPRVVGQSSIAAAEKLMPIDIPDDHIINCCLQITRNRKDVLLLSNDVNLCSKCVLHNINAMSEEAFNKRLISISKCEPAMAKGLVVENTEYQNQTKSTNINQKSLQSLQKPGSFVEEPASQTNTNTYNSFSFEHRLNGQMSGALGNEFVHHHQTNTNTNQKPFRSLQMPGSFVEKTESQPQTNTNICKSFSFNHSQNGQMPGSFVEKSPRPKTSRPTSRPIPSVHGFNEDACVKVSDLVIYKYVNAVHMCSNLLKEFEIITANFLVNVLRTGLSDKEKIFWQKRVKMKAPWTVYNLISCVCSQWISLTGDFPSNKIKFLNERLQAFFKNQDDAYYSYSDLRQAINWMEDLISMLGGVYLHLVTDFKNRLAELKTRSFAEQSRPAATEQHETSNSFSSCVEFPMAKQTSNAFYNVLVQLRAYLFNFGDTLKNILIACKNGETFDYSDEDRIHLLRSLKNDLPVNSATSITIVSSLEHLVYKNTSQKMFNENLDKLYRKFLDRKEGDFHLFSKEDIKAFIQDRANSTKMVEIINDYNSLKNSLLGFSEQLVNL